MIFWLLLFFVFLVLISTIIPILKHEAWWVRDFDFPKLQIFIIAIILLGLQVVFLKFSDYTTWVLMTITVFCIFYHAWWIAPYTAFYKKEVKKASNLNEKIRIKILVSNVLTPNRGSDKLISLVDKYDPDVLVAVETDCWWQDKLDILENGYPYTLKCPLDNKYGMHLYSRIPLKDAVIQFLVEKDIPSMHVLLDMPSGQKIRLHCIHPAPPSPSENETSSERDAELIVVAKSVAKSKLPVIVSGDLNDVAWSATTRLFRKISGLLDPRVGRGMYSTFHAGYPFFRWPLDHFFHTNHFTLIKLVRLPSIGSDHFPMFIELAYNPKEGADQNGLEADDEDKAWAEENIGEENVDEEDVHTPGE